MADMLCIWLCIGTACAGFLAGGLHGEAAN